MNYQVFVDDNNTLKHDLAEIQRTIISLEKGYSTVYIQGNHVPNRGVGRGILKILRELEIEIVEEIHANNHKLKKIEEVINGTTK